MAPDQPLNLKSSANAPIPIVMSLVPSLKRELDGVKIGQTYQYSCLEAWRAAGFRVISVNAAVEEARVRALFPDVEIAIAQRDMSEFCGKPLVPLAEMLRVLQATGARLGGIVNSDVFIPPIALAEWLSACNDHTLYFMNRREIDHPMAQDGAIYRFGFDAFFFDIASASKIACDPFTIGLPWWDYFLPIAILLDGGKVAEIADVPLLHFSHAQNWNEANWLTLFETFRQRFASGFISLAIEGAELPPLVSLIFEDQMQRYRMARSPKRSIECPELDAVIRYRNAYSISVVDLIMQMSDVVRFGNR